MQHCIFLVWLHLLLYLCSWHCLSSRLGGVSAQQETNRLCYQCPFGCCLEFPYCFPHHPLGFFTVSVKIQNGTYCTTASCSAFALGSTDRLCPRRKQAGELFVVSAVCSSLSYVPRPLCATLCMEKKKSPNKKQEDQKGHNHAGKLLWTSNRPSGVFC